MDYIADARLTSLEEEHGEENFVELHTKNVYRCGLRLTGCMILMNEQYTASMDTLSGQIPMILLLRATGIT